MSTEASLDNRGGRHSSTPSSPLPPDIVEILAQQQARMDELLEQERARNHRELAKALKAASKAQEGRIYKEMRIKVIHEELPRIRLLLKQELAPLVMEKLKVENARAAPNNDRQDSGRTTSHYLDSWNRHNRSPERVESQHCHQMRSRRQEILELQGPEGNSGVWLDERRCSVNNEDPETERAILLPSAMRAPPRRLRRSSSEAQLDDEEENHTVGSYGSKRVRFGPGPLSLRRFPHICSQPSLSSPSPRRDISRPQPSRPLSPLSRAAKSYLQAERAIPSIEHDNPLHTKEQLKDAGSCLGYYARSPDEGQGESFVPSSFNRPPRKTLGVGRPLTPMVRHIGISSEDSPPPDNPNRPLWNSPTSSFVQTRPSHGAPPLRQHQEIENTVGLVGRMPNGWYASRTCILQKTLERFPSKEYGLSSEFIPLLVFHDQRHILIECEGLYFFWHESTNSLEKIHTSQELQEILQQMDEGRLLPHKASPPTDLDPLTRMELITAKNLRYWSTPVVIHRKRSSVDRAVKQGLIRLGSEPIHESNANDFIKREGENGDNPDALYSWYLDNTRSAFDDRDFREPGYDPSSQDSPFSFSPYPPFEEGTALNKAIDLISSPSTLQGSPTYDRYTKSNSDSFVYPDAYQPLRDHIPGAPRHCDSKALSDEEFYEQEIVGTS